MSTQSEGDSKPESEGDAKPGSEKSTTKIYYCEICKVPCMSAMTLQTHFAGIKHKKRERMLKTKCPAETYEEPMSVKRPLSKNIRCLKDFMKDPDREEPLIGLEYVTEVRFKGRKEPFYECHLCQFNTEMAPMIEHLTGQRHRKTYLLKHHPDKAKRGANKDKEDKVRFLRRRAREIEKTEGLKMYKREGFERPHKPSTAAKKKARFSSSYKPENDPVLRQKALEYMENFEITSDKEATQVISIAQSLSEALKAFCEKKAALKHIRSLPSLLPPGIKIVKPHKPLASCKDNPDNCQEGHQSNGLAQLKSFLQHEPSTSHTPVDSYICQMKGKSSSHGISSKDLATVSALESSFALQQGGFSHGLNEWMKQFNQSASDYLQSTPAKEESPYFASSQSKYTAQHCQEDSSQLPENKMTDRRARNWDSRRASLDSKAYSVTSNSYSSSRSYQTDSPLQKTPPWYHNRSGKGNCVFTSSLSSDSSGPAWPQQSVYQQSSLEDNMEPCPSISGDSSYSDYQLQKAQLNNILSGSSKGFSDDILSQLRGKDAATLTRMLQRLLPFYPDLQKINIRALAQALSEIN
ncbi:uncharacterized protein LOC123035220 isoform X2 [Varanus komodoensis]|uniref:uncharacterized protein LOC123035220 isoform X2 n=1 Tax=Varanus komodoensis TaxID=61221 RepID=UPI001CF7A1B8|nr:uncharacterized protein LOC123035220 isoform X2 [Varanus komodoensis]